MALLSKKLRIGIELGTSKIKLVGLRKKGQLFDLEFFEVVDMLKKYALPPFEGIPEECYIEQLQALAAKYKLKNMDVSVVLPASSAIMQILNISADQSESELLDKIRGELKQVTDQNLDDMRIACHELEDKDSADGKIPLLVCAIPNEVVARYKRIISEAGLKENVFDLDALGVYNAFYYFYETNFGPTTIVQIDDQVSICLIIVPYKSPFFRVINLGAEHLDNGKANSENSQQGDFKWTDLELFQNLSGKKVAPGVYDNFASEVKKCIRHIQAHEGISDFERIYLTGVGPDLPELADTIQKSLKIETKMWNPVLQFANGSEQTKKNEGVHLASVIGTALRGN